MFKKGLTLICMFILQMSYLHAQQFVEVGKDIGIGDHVVKDARQMAGGLVIFDFNNDGYDDIFVVGGFRNFSKLYRNNKDGTFSDITGISGINIPFTTLTCGAAAADLDNDGDKDLIVTTSETDRNYLFENVNGYFRDITLNAGLEEIAWSSTVSFIDIELDGDLDIYLANYIGDDGWCDANFFYENKGDLKFEEKSEEYGLADAGCALASSFSDYDNDGDVDILIANDFGRTIESNKLLQNNYPDLIFSDESNSSGFDAQIFGMGIKGGDYDDDGDFDYYTTNIGGNLFYRNNGDKTFSEISLSLGVDNTYKEGSSPDSLATSWGIAWFDYDHDTDIDLFVSNGHVYPPSDTTSCYMDPNLLYKNNGDGTFTEVAKSEGLDDPKQGRGIGIIDFDNDGDLDLVQAVVSSTENLFHDTDDDRVLVFENKLEGTNKNWLKIKMRGTSDNRDAFGGRVNIYINGKKYIREVASGGTGYMSQHTDEVHFGLGAISNVSKVEAIFPNGDVVNLNNVSANQKLLIIQPYKTSTEIDICYGKRYKNKFIAYNDTTFQETFIATDGADSIVTVNLNVIPPIEEEYSVDVCFGEELNNQTWYENGSFTQDLTSNFGCDSTVTFEVNVLPPTLIQKDTSICFGGFLLETRITENTVVFDTLVNPNGCDDLVRFDVSVNDGPLFKQDFEVCRGDIFEGAMISSDTTLFKSFKTDAGCDSIFAMEVTMLDWGVRDTNVFVVEGTTYKGNTYDSDTTVYESLGMPSSNGCDSVLAVRVNVTPNSVENIERYSLEVFPNPTKNIINVKYLLKQSGATEIYLVDLVGNRVATISSGFMSAGNKVMDINFQDYQISKGTYFLRIVTNGDVITKRIIYN